MVCASRPAARLLRTAAPFELPGGYFGTTRPIIRLVVDLIIRVALYYQPKADNPADNPAVSFVVYEVRVHVVCVGVVWSSLCECYTRLLVTFAHTSILSILVLTSISAVSL